MKWKKITLVLSITTIFVVAGCKQVLDINHDPNNPSTDQATPQLLFPAAEISAASAIGGELAIIVGIDPDWVACTHHARVPARRTGLVRARQSPVRRPNARAGSEDNQEDVVFGARNTPGKFQVQRAPG